MLGTVFAPGDIPLVDRWSNTRSRRLCRRMRGWEGLPLRDERGVTTALSPGRRLGGLAIDVAMAGVMPTAPWFCMEHKRPSLQGALPVSLSPQDCCRHTMSHLLLSCRKCRTRLAREVESTGSLTEGLPQCRTAALGGALVPHISQRRRATKG